MFSTSVSRVEEAFEHQGFAEEMAAKRPRMEEEAKDGNSDGTAGGTGVSGLPIPMMLPQHQRKIDHHTIVAGGTIFIPDGYNSASDVKNNVWVKFPWEFFRLFMNVQQVMELVMDRVYWKALGVEVEFKNPVCIQEINGAEGGALAGNNLQANLFSFTDELYCTGLWTHPNSDAAVGWTEEQTNEFINAIASNGYKDDGTPAVLNEKSHSPRLFSSSHPEVKQIGMGPGQSVKHSWSIKSPYWRGTAEMIPVPITGTGEGTYNANNLARIDEFNGVIGNANLSATTAVYTQALASQFGSTVNTANDPRWNQDTNANYRLPIGMPFRDPDPIPNLWLQLQPQLGTISSVNQSVAQLQFEIKYHLAVTGRVPRMSRREGITTGVFAESNSAAYQGIFENVAGIPIYLPIQNVPPTNPAPPEIKQWEKKDEDDEYL